MSTIHAEVTEVIDAQPESIYAILADYRVSHPAILPKPYFTSVTVEQGGQGAGTIVRADMKVMGTKLAYHLIVSEPQPGRVLMETDAAAGVTTTFTVEPLSGGRQSRVTIATDAATSSGVKGWLERLLNPLVMRRIYQQELQQLARYVRG
jgi:hypothetical protein